MCSAKTDGTGNWASMIGASAKGASPPSRSPRKMPTPARTAICQDLTTVRLKQVFQELAGRGRSKKEVNALSVLQELQADCFAGLWGYNANRKRQLLDEGDLEEALRAASAIGDDRLQREAGQRVVPDSFTHGTSEQRVKWFRTGFETGSLEACDTFAAKSAG